MICMGVFMSALAVGCSESAESNFPQPAQQTVAVEEPGTVVSEAQAVSVAEAFFMSQSDDGLKTRSAAGALSSPSSVKAIKADAGEPVMHVINYPGGGWAIVSATRDYHPVLAYSDEGSFELREDMGPVDVWISETKEIIRVAETLDAESKASIRAEWARLETAYAAAASALTAPKTRASADPYTAMWNRISQLDYQYRQDGWTIMPLIDAEYNFDYYQWNTLCSEADSYGSPIEYTIIGFKTNTVMAGPFTSTRWHQRSPYNFDCSGQVVGCVPVAMA